MKCAANDGDCRNEATTEVDGPELGMTPNTDWGGTLVCDEHAEALRSDLLDVLTAAEIDHYVAPPVDRWYGRQEVV